MTAAEAQALKTAALAEAQAAQSETKTFGTRSHSKTRRALADIMSLIAYYDSVIAAEGGKGSTSLVAFRRSS